MKQNKICVIGLGYVGLTLSLTFTNSNIKIIGIENNLNTLKLLKSGKPHFFEKKQSTPEIFAKKLSQTFSGVEK